MACRRRSRRVAMPHGALSPPPGGLAAPAPPGSHTGCVRVAIRLACLARASRLGIAPAGDPGSLGDSAPGSALRSSLRISMRASRRERKGCTRGEAQAIQRRVSPSSTCGARDRVTFSLHDLSSHVRHLSHAWSSLPSGSLSECAMRSVPIHRPMCSIQTFALELRVSASSRYRARHAGNASRSPVW